MKKEEAKKIINVKKKKIDIYAKDICIEEKNNEKNIQKKILISYLYYRGVLPSWS